MNPPIADDSDGDRDLGKHFVKLERQDRIALVESLERGSSWNIDFGVMLGCSVFIAGLGLLQDSVAVIIGAMLVAPLMTPLVGIGLALIQGNFKLLRVAWKAMTIGVLISLAIGISLRWVIPGDELTMEITGRGYPNMLDLLIAFFAGVAGGYALARPELSGALPGVAIAVSLVPPLAASGIALGIREWLTAGGALLLFFTNMVAIVLGSALVFWLHGIRTTETQKPHLTWMRRILSLLTFALMVLAAVLFHNLSLQLREGETRPESLALSEDLWYQLHDRIAREEGVDFVVGMRASSKRPEDVTIVLTASHPVSQGLITELDQMVDQSMGRDVVVKINVVRQETIEPASASAGRAARGD